MIDALEITLVALLVATGWLVWDTLRAREAANSAMRAACDAQGLLFLDDTVALRSLRPVRRENGHVTLRRVYDFQYSATGHDRRYGTITLTGDRVDALDLAAGDLAVTSPH